MPVEVTVIARGSKPVKVLAHGRLPMSGHNNCFMPGDLIFHPKCGFGTVRSLAREESIRLDRRPAANAPDGDFTEEFYEIFLNAGGRLLVPVSRAESVGLRHLYYGIESVRSELCSPAGSLPADVRERAVVLRMCEQQREPGALVHAIRDLLALGHTCALSAGDRKWLDKSCLQLSTEVALVDSISLHEAKDAVNAVVHELGMQ
ncbi:MAG: hypothetical protein U0X20_21030 [Caldilineaceae bacterium]